MYTESYVLRHRWPRGTITFHRINTRALMMAIILITGQLPRNIRTLEPFFKNDTQKNGAEAIKSGSLRRPAATPSVGQWTQHVVVDATCKILHIDKSLMSSAWRVVRNIASNWQATEGAAFSAPTRKLSPPAPILRLATTSFRGRTPSGGRLSRIRAARRRCHRRGCRWRHPVQRLLAATGALYCRLQHVLTPCGVRWRLHRRRCRNRRTTFVEDDELIAIFSHNVPTIGQVEAPRVGRLPDGVRRSLTPPLIHFHPSVFRTPSAIRRRDALQICIW